MCGFVYQYKKSRNLSLEKFCRAVELQYHRGPDYQGVYYKADTNALPVEFSSNDASENACMAFGHRRLSIVDLSADSNQPVISKDEKSIMLFNGEFYNYADYITSKEMAHSDTLTLFNLIEKEGIVALDKVNGMWGLCYFSADENKLYFARDRYGKKPVYYYEDGNELIISSEIKSIFALLNDKERRINPQGLAYYLLGKQTPFLTNGQSFYQDVKSLHPGEVMVFDFDTSTLSHHSFIGFDKEFDKPFKDDDSFIKAMQYDIEEAIKLRLKSEVPVTILASGGVDSSWIAGVASKNLSISNNLSLYTCHIIGGDGQISEDLEYARSLAKDLKLPLHEVKVEKSNADDFYEISRILTQQVELPLNLFLATIPTYLMTKSMAEQGIKVVLDGVGGDEIMGGYPNYSPLVLANVYNKKLWRALSYYGSWKAFDKPNTKAKVQMLKSSIKTAMFGNNINSVAHQFSQILNPYIANAALKNSMEVLTNSYFTRDFMTDQTDVQLYEVQKYQLPYYLGVADQMSMINSVENRSPFLDKNLYKYIFMPEHLKFQKGFNKYALRASMPDNIGDRYRWRQGKKGIGNAFSQDLVKGQKPYECIMESKFLRSFIDVDKVIHDKSLPIYHHVIRPLFSLALLDDIYGIRF